MSDEGAPAAERAFDAVIFDMDGVVTRTARLHAGAWKALFDDFLRRRAKGGSFTPFDARADYLTYVDGRPRHEGVRAFLDARGIAVPEGAPDDPPEAETIHGLGKRKDALFVRRLHRAPVEVYPAAVELLRALREGGIRTGVVTSSRHGREVLEAAHVAELFDARIDGLDAERLGLRGKPHPDPFLRCARALGVVPARAVVVEDAASGVEAGRRGGFALVVGVDRGGNRDALAAEGAELVVSGLDEISLAGLDAGIRTRRGDVAWRIEQEGLDPAHEPGMLSIFTVGNGYLGVRGGLDLPLPGSLNDLFVAGVYDRKRPERPYSEQEFLGLGRGDYPYSELVSLPFPLGVALRVDDEGLDFGGEGWRVQRRTLDLREGILHAEAGFETGIDRRVTLRARRCASADDLHLLLQEVSVRLESHSGTVELDGSLPGVDSPGRYPHLLALEPPAADPGLDVRRFVTRASGVEICLAARTTLVGRDEDAVCWRLQAGIGETLTFRRLVAVWTSRDAADPARAALDHLRARSGDDFDSLVAAHRERWHEVWARADVRIGGSPAAEQALRFHTYHLFSAADHDPRVSVTARSLTGRAYEGHVFWDVEIFMLPFYLHTCPALARCLLLYRHHTLDGARQRAGELGFRGACYAWESTVTGHDVTPRTIRLKTTGKDIPIYTGTEQIHVTADVAYGVWRYWDATHDGAFLCEAGAEILIETARFWASRCVPGPRGYHIRGVVGPDEYHHTVDDNAFTNWMARFNLEKAIWVVAWLEREAPETWGPLAERLGLTPGEVGDWSAVERELHVPRPRSDGVIEQFEGFFDLEAYPLPAQERFKAPVSRLFDWDRINRLRLIKQADVLMLPFLFPDAFPSASLDANYRYYEPLTDHGSSLSPAVHATLAARLGRREEAERYWRQSLWLDLSDVMGNSALGVHPACMGATWQALVFGYLGVRFTETGPVSAPGAAAGLPERWSSVALELAWRGKTYPVEVHQ